MPLMDQEIIGGRFKVLRELGRGGMGVVYLVQEGRNQPVALKLLDSKKFTESALKHFEQEFKTLTALSHPNLTEVYDYGRHQLPDGAVVPFFTMEFIDGQTLDSHIRKARHDYPALYRILAQVGQALGYLHARGLVHQDIKPGNIMVSPGEGDAGEVHLTDLGLVGSVGMSTDAGMIRGTVAYLPPEAAGGGQIDPRSDLYSLGCVIYEMVTGHPPFQGGSALAVLRGHRQEEPIRPATIVRTLPGKFEKLILRMLSKDPGLRPSGVDAFLEALEELAGHGSTFRTPESRRQSVLGAGFTGREQELGRLKRLMADTCDGGGRLVLVEGESGIGKSRFLREFQVHCQMEGYGSFIGRPNNHLGGGGALLDALTQAAGESDAGDDLGGLDRNGLFASANEMLTRAGSRGPMVLAVEDLHESDETVCRLLAHLAATAASERLGSDTSGLPVLLIGTYRGDQVSRSSPLFALLADPGRDFILEEIVLGGLGVEETRSMVRAMTGIGEIDDGFNSRVYEETRGNPLHIAELIAHLAQEGLLVPGGERHPDVEVLDGTPLPGQIRNLLERRLDRLDDDAALILRTATILGPSAVDPETVSAVSGLRWEAATARMIDLRADGILIQELDDAGSPVYRLTRPALGELALAGSGPEELKQIHRAAVSFLDRKGIPRTYPAWAAFASHAESAGLPGRAMEGWAKAGELAARLFANRDAIDAFTRALDLARKDRSSSVALLCGLFRQRGRARTRAGEFSLAEEDFRWMLARAEKDRDDGFKARAHLLLGRLFEDRSRYDQAQENLELALEIAGRLELPDLSAEAMIALGRIDGILGDVQQGREHLRQAVRFSSENDLADHQVSALLALGALERDQGDPVASLESFREAEAVAGEHMSPEVELAILEGAGRALEMQGQYAQALDALNRARDGAVRRGDVKAIADATAGLGAVRMKTGDYPSASRDFETALQLHRRLGAMEGMIDSLMSLGRMHLLRGRFQEALDHVDEALGLARRLGRKDTLASALSLRASVHIRAGDPGQADGLLTEAEKLLGDSLNLRRRAGLMLDQGDLRAAREQQAPARQAFQESAFLARRIGDARLEAAAMIRLGESFLQDSDIDRAAVAGRKAARLVENRGLPREEADAWVLRARVELARPGGDTVQAEIDAMKAVERYRTLGETERLWQAEHVAGRAAVRSGRPDQGRERIGRGHRYLEKIRSRLTGSWEQTFLEDRRRRELYEDFHRMEMEPGARSGKGDHGPAGATGDPARSGAGNGEENVILRRLLEINRTLNSTRDVDDLLQVILDAACEITGAERGFLLLKDGREITTRIVRKPGDQSSGTPANDLSRSIARKVIDDGEPMLSTDAEQDSRFKGFESVHALNIRSVLAVPLRIRDVTEGAVYLDNRIDRRLFEPAHLEYASMLADQAGIALGTAALLGRIEEQAASLVEANLGLERTVNTQQEELESVREELFSSRSSFELRYRFEDMIGGSAGMQMVYHLIERLAEKKLPVLITGESGAGKELIARALHRRSGRHRGPFFTVNCAALTESLLESELFGHRKGAFTGADRNKPGYFELADCGTLFLDEIGEMGQAMQAKLLRVIEQGEVMPVGGKEMVQVDVRIVSATHRDLKEMIRNKEFREDLYYRINVGRIEIPPLRDRREDIPLLADHFLAAMADEEQEPRKEFEADALRKLVDYSWPGNVRELQHQILRIATFVKGTAITLRDVLRYSDVPERADPAGAGGEDSGTESLEEMERKQILKALEEAGGNKTRAAEILGINRATLFRKLKRFELKD
ncbi:MAG: sigma 54-interacting transcriptional regulator [Acidobacteria bacterium]|uniref:Sigma 54-interacting transcriptional regulator n=1 Tax=Candidatus Polarisedimenticola svalbardensis TaxID=2886004 RepID=A0A8J6Y9N8_9BACT|nr:sigma 54-interacting transcriptional regulator [Candidatus Polarisedimenticola svalbardensis]